MMLEKLHTHNDFSDWGKEEEKMLLAVSRAVDLLQQYLDIKGFPEEIKISEEYETAESGFWKDKCNQTIRLCKLAHLKEKTEWMTSSKFAQSLTSRNYIFLSDLEKKLEGIRNIVLDDVPHKYQARLLEALK